MVSGWEGIKKSLLGLQNQASSFTDSSGAKKSTHLGAFICSYSSSSTNMDSILFQSIFAGSISQRLDTERERERERERVFWWWERQ
jgi:hypothetical protein